MFAIIGIVLLVILLVGIPTFFYLDQGQKITAALVPWSTQEPSRSCATAISPQTRSAARCSTSRRPSTSVDGSEDIIEWGVNSRLLVTDNRVQCTYFIGRFSRRPLHGCPKYPFAAVA